MPRPWISCNLAVSADGKITSTQKQSSTWTSAADHARLISLRQKADALMIGRGTLDADRMSLTVPGKSPQPLRCVVSQHGNLSPEHPVFHTPGGAIHILTTDGGNPNPQLPATFHHLSLMEFLKTLSKTHGVNHLHCEGGGQLIRSLAEMDAIDEFHITLAGHTIWGGQKAPTATGLLETFLPQARSLEISHFEPHPESGECFLSFRILRS
jgi:riboflavin-specific deaminase-like protein